MNALKADLRSPTLEAPAATEAGRFNITRAGGAF